jgi:leucyl aminopeptidase
MPTKTHHIDLHIKDLSPPKKGDWVVFTDHAGTLSPAIRTLLGEQTLAQIQQASKIEHFTGERCKRIVLTAPPAISADRLIVVGLGKKNASEKKDQEPQNWSSLGGTVLSALSPLRNAHIFLDMPAGFSLKHDALRDFCEGLYLRAYSFKSYKTKKKYVTAATEVDDKDLTYQGTLHIKDTTLGKAALEDAGHVTGGVYLARDLVNMPANDLYPETFAQEMKKLASLGLDVKILDETKLKSIGMGALLAVGQGSHRPSRVAILSWKGAKKSSEKPVAFVGKGVCFDSGGISIKPSQNMEEMKGDMGGAAAVAGVMKVLAARKARVNAIGVLGLVENMPGGNAQRPGDIVTSLSGQKIEIVNTDAEGRLVLADILWYTEETFDPVAMIDLATLTGAITVALGPEYAGLFSNNDTLATRLFAQGEATGEKVWRLPLGKAYDKMIDSIFADMKNAGARYAGAITAAQFLQRFVRDCPWAHLDIAGTAFRASDTAINTSWGSGWGVRILDSLVRSYYED